MMMMMVMVTVLMIENYIEIHNSAQFDSFHVTRGILCLDWSLVLANGNQLPLSVDRGLKRLFLNERQG